MYFIERYLGSLKSHVRNKTQAEASIAKAHLTVECGNFCALYLQGFCSKFGLLLGITYGTGDVVSLSKNEKEKLFSQIGKPIGKPCTSTITQMNKIQAHCYVLFNCKDVQEYLK